jgi:hypothetical protein
VHKLDPPANQDIRRRDRVNAPHELHGRLDRASRQRNGLMLVLVVLLLHLALSLQTWWGYSFERGRCADQSLGWNRKISRNPLGVCGPRRIALPRSGPIFGTGSRIGGSPCTTT